MIWNLLLGSRGTMLKENFNMQGETIPKTLLSKLSSKKVEENPLVYSVSRHILLDTGLSNILQHGKTKLFDNEKEFLLTKVAQPNQLVEQSNRRVKVRTNKKHRKFIKENIYKPFEE
jgi:hypothetical protein